MRQRPLLLLHQFLVHIIPVLVIVLQKIPEIPLVINDQPRDALLLQQLRHRVQTRRGGV